MKKNTPISNLKILVVLCSFILGNTYSQVTNQASKTLFGKTITAKNSNPNTGIIRCATVEYEQFLQENNPNRLKEASFEKWLSPLVNKYKAARTSSKMAAIVLKIPVVVHVIHNGEAIGVAPNITDAQVESQITVLNQDFRRMLGTRGYNTTPVGADVEIEFVLAKVDPNGNPTNGIDRVNSGQATWFDIEIDQTLKPATIWDPSQYMNMWSVKFSSSTVLGYAQFPDASGLPGLNASGGASNTDGVVSSYDVFGSSDFSSSFLLAAPYDKGRTMTHEVGHFLGLRHIWGDGTGDEKKNIPDCAASDYCADTPQAGWEHYSCGNFDTCIAATGNDMVENYMDYTNDECMNIFTQNQKDRIIVIMNNAVRRNTLNSSTKGTAIPIFANDVEVKIENDLTLINVADCASLPAPTNKKVTFTNRGTSTITVITLNYSMAGDTNKTLTWTGSPLAQNESTIVTLAFTASFGVLNVSIGTTNGTTDERVSNNTDSKTFGPVNYNFTNFVFRLQQDFWGSEITWDLRDASGIVKYSGGPYTDKPESSLVLPALITQNWALANNQCYTFTINDSQGDGICCDGGSGYYNIKSTPANGSITVASGASYAYIENIQFTTNVLGTNEFETSNDIYLYPNPTKNTLNISIPSAFGLPNSYVISNVMGQKISQKEVSKQADLTLNTGTLSNGIYFITIMKEGQKKTLRFIKE